MNKAFMEEVFTNATVENIHFSHHDVVRIVIEKNSVDFILLHKVQYDHTRRRNLFIFLGVYSRWP